MRFASCDCTHCSITRRWQRSEYLGVRTLDAERAAATVRVDRYSLVQSANGPMNVALARQRVGGTDTYLHRSIAAAQFNDEARMGGL